MALDNVSQEQLEQTLFQTLEDILKVFGEYSADLALLSAEEIARLNLEHRQVDKPTDVLSFPYLQLEAGELPSLSQYPNEVIDDKLMLGCIALCPEIICSNAREYGHTLEREYGYMLVHSVLHLLGYDHLTDTDKSKMRAEEKRVCALLKLEEQE